MLPVPEDTACPLRPLDAERCGRMDEELFLDVTTRPAELRTELALPRFTV